MTDRDTKLRAVAARFLGWEPGKMCEARNRGLTLLFDAVSEDIIGHRCEDCGATGRIVFPHELPPPDPADPVVRVALEDALLNAGWTVSFMPEGHWIYAQVSQAKIRRVARGSIPADALLDAAYQVRGEEKS